MWSGGCMEFEGAPLRVCQWGSPWSGGLSPPYFSCPRNVLSLRPRLGKSERIGAPLLPATH